MSNQVEVNKNEENGNKKKPESKGVLSRVSIPDVLAVKAQEVLLLLKGKGADIKVDDLFQDLFAKVDDRYWERQEEKLTPDIYIFEQAKRDPALMAALIKKAKKGLEKSQRGEQQRKTRKKENTSSEASL